MPQLVRERPRAARLRNASRSRSWCAALTHQGNSIAAPPSSAAAQLGRSRAAPACRPGLMGDRTHSGRLRRPRRRSARPMCRRAIPGSARVDDLVEFARRTRSIRDFTLPISAETRLLQMLRIMGVADRHATGGAYRRAAFSAPLLFRIGNVPVLDMLRQADRRTGTSIVKSAFDRMCRSDPPQPAVAGHGASRARREARFERAGVVRQCATASTTKIEVYKYFRSMYVDQLDPAASQVARAAIGA